MVLRTLTEGFAEQEDVAAEVCLFNKGVGPNRLEHVLLGDDFPAMPDQHQEDLKRLRGERDGFIAAQEKLLFRVDSKRAELVKVLDFRV